MRFIIYLWASYIYWLFCSDPQSPAKDKRRKFLQGSRSSYDFYQTTAGDGSDIRDQSSNSVRADQGQSESCANEVLSTARGAEQQLTAEIDRELNAIIKITLGRAKGTSASSRWDILVLSLIKIFSSFFFWICPSLFPFVAFTIIFVCEFICSLSTLIVHFVDQKIWSSLPFVILGPDKLATGGNPRPIKSKHAAWIQIRKRALG